MVGSHMTDMLDLDELEAREKAFDNVGKMRESAERIAQRHIDEVASLRSLLARAEEALEAADSTIEIMSSVSSGRSKVRTGYSPARTAAVLEEIRKAKP